MILSVKKNVGGKSFTFANPTIPKKTVSMDIATITAIFGYAVIFALTNGPTAVTEIDVVAAPLLLEN
jgi:hypothetical protein